MLSPHRRQTSAQPARRLDQVIGDEARFFRSWLGNPLKTGAVSPSGRALAGAMARVVDAAQDGPVIELGPGTGPVTDALVRRGVAPERLVLVEFNPAFCKLLAKRFPKAKILQGDAYHLGAELRALVGAPAIAVVSSLPLLTKPERDRLRLLNEAFAISAPGAPFIQFTYGITPPIPRKLSGPDCAYSAEGSAPVWLNLPPARVWVYRRAAPR